MSVNDHDSLSKEEREANEARDRQREQEEQAALPYKWTQDLETLSVTVPLPPGVRGRDCVVVIERKKLKVGVKGSEPILEGELFNEVSKDDSSWTIEDGVMTIELEKFSWVGNEVGTDDRAHIKSHQWWPHVLTHHPKIDTTKIQPANSKLSDLDGETRGMVEKMMFDNQQKAMGKPTSDELKKLEMLDKFKKMHPEMDFSNAKVG